MMRRSSTIPARIPRWLRERMLSLRALRAARDERERARSDDSDPGEGRGAFGWAILSTLLVIGAAIGAYSAHVLR